MNYSKNICISYQNIKMLGLKRLLVANRIGPENVSRASLNITEPPVRWLPHTFEKSILPPKKRIIFSTATPRRDAIERQ